MIRERFDKVELTESDIKKFWTYKTMQVGKHTLWLGPGDRYGLFWVPSLKIQVLAHKVAYILYHGEVPEGLVVGHDCNIMRCITESCLVAMTSQENYLDALRDGLANPPKGEEHWKAVLNEEVVRIIRCMADEGYKARAIGELLGFARQTIQDVIAFRTWNHVDAIGE